MAKDAHDAPAVQGGAPGSGEGTAEGALDKSDAQQLRDAVANVVGAVMAPAGLPVVLAALAILTLGLVVSLTIPQFYARLDSLQAHLPQVVVTQSREALEVTTARAALYPLADGGRAMVVRGDVRNISEEPQAVTDVQLHLKDSHGFVVAASKAPLGFSPRLVEVFRLTDDQGWQKLVQQTRAIGRAPLAPGATASFMLVVVQPPEDLAAVTPEISLP